jgi:FlaA1/EpsC-like NDP-sugar epimerase
MILDGKRVLVTGGTGSLGQVLVRRLLSGEVGTPERIIVFSRDEAKQHFMRLSYEHQRVSTDEVIYDNFKRRLQFVIADVRNYGDVCGALRGADVVINAAALKQVPTCEYFPEQAIATNCTGASNIARALRDHGYDVETVVGISTDKACKPVNVMGMTKALQERIFIAANIASPKTRSVVVRYGNVLASRGSVIPLFHEQIRMGGPVTITSPDMTRFLISLDEAVDTVFAAVADGQPGETYIPICPSATIPAIADALIGERAVETTVTGARPGEKLHEVLVSEEEIRHAVRRGNYYAIAPMLPELAGADFAPLPDLTSEYSSSTSPSRAEDIRALLERHHLLVEQQGEPAGELLR